MVSSIIQIEINKMYWCQENLKVSGMFSASNLSRVFFLLVSPLQKQEAISRENWKYACMMKFGHSMPSIQLIGT